MSIIKVMKDLSVDNWIINWIDELTETLDSLWCMYIEESTFEDDYWIETSIIKFELNWEDYKIDLKVNKNWRLNKKFLKNNNWFYVDMISDFEDKEDAEY